MVDLIVPLGEEREQYRMEKKCGVTIPLGNTASNSHRTNYDIESQPQPQSTPLRIIIEFEDETKDEDEEQYLPERKLTIPFGNGIVVVNRSNRHNQLDIESQSQSQPTTPRRTQIENDDAVDHRDTTPSANISEEYGGTKENSRREIMSDGRHAGTIRTILTVVSELDLREALTISRQQITDILRTTLSKLIGDIQNMMQNMHHLLMRPFITTCIPTVVARARQGNLYTTVEQKIKEYYADDESHQSSFGYYSVSAWSTVQSGISEANKFRQKLSQYIEVMNSKTQYVYLILMMYLIPFLLYFASLHTITVFFWIGFFSMIAVSCNNVCELFGALHLWKDRRKIHASNIHIAPQLVTAIVSAYLPNEIDILKDTLDAMLKIKLPPGCTSIILVSHNGGKPHEQERLRNIIAKLPYQDNYRVEEVDHPDSRSKAENVNGALDYLKAEGKHRPDIVVLYDADHQPDENAWIYALETMTAKNADLLQGRCCINRGNMMIACEFDTLYGINHAGGEVVHGFAFFGGTNGFWKFDLLDKIRMDTSMLTEDVDSAFRSLASGAEVVYDPMVVSYEEAPPCFQTLIKQRLRWTQGWSEVAVRHIPLIWKEEFSWRRRFMICFLLHFRELYFYTSSLVLPAAIVFGMRQREIIMHVPLLLVGVCPLFLPIIMTLVARYLCGSAHVHPDLGVKEYVQYFFVSIPYEALKVMIAVLGHYRNLAGINKWEITRLV